MKIYKKNKKVSLLALCHCFASVLYPHFVSLCMNFLSVLQQRQELNWSNLVSAIFNSSIKKKKKNPTSPHCVWLASPPTLFYPPSALTYMVVTWPGLPGSAFYGKSAGDKATGF